MVVYLELKKDKCSQKKYPLGQVHWYLKLHFFTTFFSNIIHIGVMIAISS